MSRIYFLVAPHGREFILLGGKDSDGIFDGPALWIDEHASLLPKEMLDELVRNFRSAHEKDGGVEILVEGFADDVITDDFVEVGGDANTALPIWKYLEKSNCNIDKIKSTGRRLR